MMHQSSTHKVAPKTVQHHVVTGAVQSKVLNTLSTTFAIISQSLFRYHKYGMNCDWEAIQNT